MRLLRHLTKPLFKTQLIKQSPVYHALFKAPVHPRYFSSANGLPSTYNPVTPQNIAHFTQILGENNVITDADDLLYYSTDWMKKYIGDSAVVLRPETTEQVSEILAYCNKNLLPIVPQGGNTSLVGGSVPIKKEIVLLLTKMNKVLDFDATQGVLQCEAGMVLETAINLVGKHGYDIPYDLGARGSCTIGGNVSTHAGGINFVKYGPLRGNVLGLEVVLPSGKILNMMNTARKDSTGPDLKQIFIQSEGTLGIITKVALRCEASSPEKKLMFLDVTEYSHVLQVLNFAKQKFGRNLSAIEYMDHQSYDLVHSFKHKLLDFPFTYDQSLDQSQVKKWYV
jgi:FAD/FMN-containing dehydrogenase